MCLVREAPALSHMSSQIGQGVYTHIGLFLNTIHRDSIFIIVALHKLHSRQVSYDSWSAESRQFWHIHRSDLPILIS